MLKAILLAALPLAAATPFRMKRAPLHTPRDAVEGKYIVKMKESSDVSLQSIDDAVASIAADATSVFGELGGFAAELTPEEVDTLRDNPDVEYIEQETEVSLFSTQYSAPWGLARLSNKVRGSETYTYNDAAGEGVCAYVLDSGIQIDHPEFGGRVTFVATFVDGIEIDDHGHGTHIAGTIGATKYGVAKKTKLFAVKSFKSTGKATSAAILGGIDAILADAPTRDCPNGVVVNFSWGAIKSTAIDDGAASLVNAGYFVGAAAGNGDENNKPVDVSTVSPASISAVCTVGSTDSADRVATSSNYGAAVDVYAPGVSILSTIPGSRTGVKSGTSMATPHVVGLAAYFLSLGEPVATLCEHIKNTSLPGVIANVPNGTVNLLVQNDMSA